MIPALNNNLKFFLSATTSSQTHDDLKYAYFKEIYYRY